MLTESPHHVTAPVNAAVNILTHPLHPLPNAVVMVLLSRLTRELRGKPVRDIVARPVLPPQL